MARNIETHEFYCMNCGKRNIPLARKRGFQHSKFHRKKLYCFNCKKEVNMIECKNDFEVAEFLENFANGVYKEEAEKSLSHCQGGR